MILPLESAIRGKWLHRDEGWATSCLSQLAGLLALKNKVNIDTPPQKKQRFPKLMHNS